MLALLAGFFNFGVVVWPFVAAAGRGDISPVWRIGGIIAGAVYIAAFFLADRRWKLAKLLLVLAALAQILIAITFGRAYEVEGGFIGQLIGLFDFFPAILALTSALLVGPAPARKAGSPTLSEGEHRQDH